MCLFYQNGIESLHDNEKWFQCFKMSGAFEAFTTNKSQLKRKEYEEYEEVSALYGDSDIFFPRVQKLVCSNWHSWSLERRERHIKDFQAAGLTVKQIFVKPVNIGRKPSCQ